MIKTSGGPDFAEVVVYKKVIMSFIVIVISLPIKTYVSHIVPDLLR